MHIQAYIESVYSSKTVVTFHILRGDLCIVQKMVRILSSEHLIICRLWRRKRLLRLAKISEIKIHNFSASFWLQSS